jgi:hypothetical protein
MTRFHRTFALAALAAFALGATIPATAHADQALANLPVTDEVRTELVHTASVLTGRPASEFGGLRDKATYYAQDANGMQWAAAALYAKPDAYWAAIELQDQNSYFAFVKSAEPGSTWIPTAIGFGPIPAGQEPCPLPATIRDLWGWPAGKCHP